MARLTFATPKLGPLERPMRLLRRQLPPLNFITIHYLYFVVTCMLSSLILWGSATPPQSLKYTDALFLSVSAMTEAGLNTVNLSTLNSFQQFWLFLEIILGSAIFVSAFVVLVRRRAFEAKFRDVIKKQREEERERRGRSRSRGHHRSWSLGKRTSHSKNLSLDHEEKRVDDKINESEDTFTDSPNRDINPPAQFGHSELSPVMSNDENEGRAPGLKASMSPSQTTDIKFSDDTVFEHRLEPQSPTTVRRKPGIFTAQGVGARSSASLHPMSPPRIVSADNPVPDTFPGLQKRTDRYSRSVGGYVSRNSEFHGLSDKEREKLGGYEYRAVKVLSWLVPAYFILWQLLGTLGCAAWIIFHRPETAGANGLQPGWVGAFNAVSAFNNSGMSLLDANMTAFQNAYYLLLTMGLLILAGNTAYPVFLRLIVWTMYQVVKRFQNYWEGWDEHANTLKFLLDHPRRCYTNLFPSQHTWWLALCLVTLNGVDWAAFEILNIGNSQIDLSSDERVIDGLFQALAVRSGGFYVVSISTVRISLQVLYVVMMYISVYPVVITMRNSNVYEERSLGIYAEDEYSYAEKQPSGEDPGFLRQITEHLVGGSRSGLQSNAHFVRQQLRAQLAHDAWTIVVALFLIMIIEGGQFNSDSAQFSVFNFLFEIVSGYGCVGISVGLQNEAYSFCGSWHVLSKLILCVVMLRGRHRGLPVAIDRAVLLPGEENERAEEDDGRIRLARTISRGGGEGA